MNILKYFITTVVLQPVHILLMEVIYEDTSAPLIYYFWPVAFG